MVLHLDDWAECQQPLILMKSYTGSRTLTDSEEIPKQGIMDMRFGKEVLKKYDVGHGLNS
jgi:hypothetical protein